MKWTEAKVVEIIRRHFLIGQDCAAGTWSLLTQVPYAGRVIDALLVHENGMTMAVEIKVSLADFRNETPEKRAASVALADSCWYAAPQGLLTPEMMPPDWGLVVVDENDRGETTTMITKGPGVLRTRPYPFDLVPVLARRASDAEEAIRRGEIPAAAVAQLRADNDRLRGIAARAMQTRDVERRRAQAARSELMSLDGAQECADCGHDVEWKRGGENDSRWVHVDPAHEPACRQIRAQRAKTRKEGATGAAYLGGWADPIEPVAFRRDASAAAG